MTRDDIKVGSLWRHIQPTTSEFYTSGHVYAVASQPDTDGGMFRMEDNLNKGADARHHWNISTFMQAFVTAETGWPVRTVTRMEIVPGTYGRIRVYGYEFGRVRVSIMDTAGLDAISMADLEPDDLRAAAAVFNSLAEAMEETP